MKEEAQRIAIAEACGWSNVRETAPERGSLKPRLLGSHIAPDGVPSTNFIPDYLNDLNAMHEAEKMLTPEQREQYVFWLSHVCELGTYVFATAAQRAEAFLRTLNLWKD